MNTTNNDDIDLGPQSQMIRVPLYDNSEDITLICDNEVFDLGAPPLLIRSPSYNDYEVEELDGSFKDYQNNTTSDFKIPNPCEKCYTFSCNNLCCEEEIELPPPQPLKRMFTNSHLPDDEPEDEDNFDVPEGTQYISIQTNNK